MKIGFVRDINSRAEIVKLCDDVVYANPQITVSENILKFIEEYPKEELVFQSILELRLQISQLLPLLEKIIEQHINVHFMHKRIVLPIEDLDYIKILLVIAQQEKEIRSICAKESLGKARKKGSLLGRPAINESIISQIDFFYNNQGYSIRKVAAICGVSVGTVHKYLK